MLLQGLAVVRELLDAELRHRLHHARRSEHLQHDVPRVLAPRVGDLVDEGVDREGVEDVVDGPHPADPHVGIGLARLRADVGHRDAQVQHALLQIAQRRAG